MAMPDRSLAKTKFVDYLQRQKAAHYPPAPGDY